MKKGVLTKEYRDLLEGIETLLVRSVRPNKVNVIK